MRWRRGTEDLYAYRSAPIEFCEVASMSMELLGNEFLEQFYAAAGGQPRPPDASGGDREHLPVDRHRGCLSALDLHASGPHPRGAEAAWTELMDRFGGEVDWRGYEAARAHLWHRQLHIFIHAFYYIEYGIAQLGALQVWANARRDRARALRQYKEALKLGGAQPLPRLFNAAGCRFDFSRPTLAPLVRLVREELDKLRAAESSPG